MRSMLDKFGASVVCVDSTHGTTIYPDYVFGVLLVVDETGAGQPGAFFSSARKAKNIWFQCSKNYRNGMLDSVSSSIYF